MLCLADRAGHMLRKHEDSAFQLAAYFFANLLMALPICHRFGDARAGNNGKAADKGSGDGASKDESGGIFPSGGVGELPGCMIDRDSDLNRKYARTWCRFIEELTVVISGRGEKSRTMQSHPMEERDHFSFRQPGRNKPFLWASLSLPPLLFTPQLPRPPLRSGGFDLLGGPRKAHAASRPDPFSPFPSLSFTRKVSGAQIDF